ncbi:dibenzothiophene-5,5-dioxide monooxygenase [Arboricoccus pini]|uniref:Dibenzothiophene-5,5-dioxide monooxygenase n=2 Tax=Arboricoccus pini TaxID=1963835 RepID=A0A212RIQ0_9PROT|nr:dibenzothiophene-5,5-dioxide monooxygenase [Arboricoccus pini]
MHLVAYLFSGPTSHHHGMWRHPFSTNKFLEPEFYEHLARTLEEGFFDALFFADVQGIYDYVNDSYDAILGKGGQIGLLDPIPLISQMARVTSRIGLGLTLSTTFVRPYMLARLLGTLDILSKGRMAWNVVTSAGAMESRNFDIELPPRDERYDRADEVVEACMKLWHSWEDDAFIIDKDSGEFVDTSKVHRANYEGKWIKTRGPLTTPRSEQGYPVIMQAGSSERGREFGARWGELIFTLQHAKEDMIAFYNDFKGRMEKYGRSPRDCAILTSADPIVGETESIAREKQAFINERIDPTLAIALVSSHTGIDFTKFPQDRPIEDIRIEEGSRGSFDVILQGSKAKGLTLADAAKQFATSELCPQLVGTPESVADQMQDLFESGAVDGFVLTPTELPGTFETFSRSVVPVLQKRGIFRKSYAGSTLRQHLHD